MSSTGIKTSEITSAPPSPPKFTPISTLLESMRVTKLEKSPYKINGPELPVSIWEPEGGEGSVWVRVDMPGVNRIDVKADEAEDPEVNCRISFSGFEEEITMHGINKGDDVCRVYQGCLQFDAARFPFLDFTHDFCDGVLHIKINSHLPGRNGEIGVTMRAENEITKESAINPLVSVGLDRHSIYRFTDKAFVFAIDMPGIGELDTVNLNWLSNTINFYAEDKTTSLALYGESLDDVKRRQYQGYFKLNLSEFDLSKAQFEIIHGVFWIMVPRTIKPPIALLTIFDGTHETKIYNQP